jgi:hypothetical protein
MCQDQRENNFRELLNNYRNYYGVYHHHKEMMAWLATTFYISGSIFFFFKLEELINGKCYNAILFVIIFIIITGITFAFIRWQFKQRAFASKIVSACTTILTCRLSQSPLPDDSFKPWTFKESNKDKWPKILVEYAERKERSHVVSEVWTYAAIAIFVFVVIIKIFIICKQV